MLIAAAVVATVALGVSMCRLAALSDRKHAGALADWAVRGHGVEHEPWTVERLLEELPFDAEGEAFRAAG
jgi:hypothetical protein